MVSLFKKKFLLCAFKFKGSAFSLSEDVSVATRVARGRLIAFAKSQPQPYKLRCDKLYIGERTLIDDPATTSFKDLTRSECAGSACTGESVTAKTMDISVLHENTRRAHVAGSVICNSETHDHQRSLS